MPSFVKLGLFMPDGIDAKTLNTAAKDSLAVEDIRSAGMINQYEHAMKKLLSQFLVC
jgi:hypothetical protein